MNITLKIEKLILFTIASSAIGVGVSYSDFYLFHLFIIFLVIVLVFKEKDNNYLFYLNLGSTNYTLFFFVILFWYIIYLMWTLDLTLGLKYIFYLLCGISISLIIIHFSKSTKRLNEVFKILRIIFIFELILAFLESFSFFRWPISPYSSWHPFFGKELFDLSSLNQFSYLSFNPPTGFHWNTNNLAIVMIIILPFFLCHHKFSVKLIGIISITLITALAASRAVFLGLIFIFCFYLILIKKKIGILFFIWLLIGSIFLGMNILKDSKNPRLNEVANTIQAIEYFLSGDIDVGGSIEWRRQLINDGIKALKKSNGLGIGAGASTALQEKTGGVAGRFTSMHNFWVEILVEGGLMIGFLGLLWYSSIIFKLFRIINSSKNNQLVFYAQSLLLSMIAFVPASISASSTIYFFPMWIMFGMSISVISLFKFDN